MALFFAGCTIESYLTDADNVHCDGRRTRTEFNDNVSQVTFHVHQDDVDPLAVTVTRTDDDTYGFEVDAPGEMPVDTDVLVDPVRDGTGEPDYSFTHEDAVWSVDVRPDEPSAVISGSC